MCRPVTCEVCGKTTWAGCGQHIDMVKATVAPENWCPGQHTAAELEAAREKRQSSGIFGRIFGR